MTLAERLIFGGALGAMAGVSSSALPVAMKSHGIQKDMQASREKFDAERSKLLANPNTKIPEYMGLVDSINDGRANAETYKRGAELIQLSDVAQYEEAKRDFNSDMNSLAVTEDEIKLSPYKVYAWAGGGLVAGVLCGWAVGPIMRRRNSESKPHGCAYDCE